jgi:hypothetical protein
LSDTRKHAVTLIGVSVLGATLLAGAAWLWLSAATLLDHETRVQEELTVADVSVGTQTYDVVCKPIRSFAQPADGGSAGKVPSDGYVDDADIGSLSVPSGELGSEIHRVCEGRRTWTTNEISSRRSAAGLLGGLGFVLIAVGYGEWRLRRSLAREVHRVERAIENAARK